MGGLKPAVVERGPYYVQNSSLQILRTAACLLGCLVMTAHATSSDCVKGFVPTQYSRPAYLACMAAPNLNGKPIGAGAMNVMGASNGVGGIQLNGKPNGCSRQHLKEHNPTNGIPDGGIVIGACMPKSESHCLAQEAAKLGIHASSEERRSPLRSYSTGSLKKGDTPLTRLPRTSTSFFKKQFNSELQAIPSNDVSSNIPDHLDGRTEFIAECKLPTEKGAFMLRSYRYKGAKIVIRNGERVIEWTEMEPVVVMHGDLQGKENVLVRVHDQCFTSEVLGSKRCDCKEQLDMAMLHILQNEGAVIYMPQEGRGIGLANKIAAYELQDGGLDTVDANRHLGFEDDERSYSCVPFILQDMGIESVQLITNNPYKIHHLKDSGVKIDSVTPSIVVPNMHNLKYLRTKAERMAHLLSLDMLQVHQTKSAGPLGPQTLEKAVQALRDGGVAMLLRGQGASAEAALVVRADLASGESVSDMSRLSDGFVSAVLTPERWRQLGLGEGGGDDEVPVSADAADMIAMPMSSEGRAKTLRALGDASTQLSALKRPGHVYIKKSSGESTDDLISGALKLIEMAGGSAAGISQLLTKDGLSAPGLCEATQIAETLGVVVTCVEDVVAASA